jgi:hypothetical protein
VGATVAIDDPGVGARQRDVALRCDSTGVSLVNDVENANTSGATVLRCSAAARIRCR